MESAKNVNLCLYLNERSNIVFNELIFQINSSFIFKKKKNSRYDHIVKLLYIKTEKFTIIILLRK